MLFEAVQVEEMQGENRIAIGRRIHRLLEAKMQQQPVGQPGQHVMMGEVVEIALRPLAIADVERGGQDGRDTVGIVGQRRLRGQEDMSGPLRVADFLLEIGQGHACREDPGIQLPAAVPALPVEPVLIGALGRPVFEQFRLERIGEDAHALTVGGADERRHRVDDLRQALAVVAQQLLALALDVVELLRQRMGTAADELLLSAELEEVAGPRDEFMVVDRALEEIRGPGFQRLEPEVAILVGGDDHDRHFRAACGVARMCWVKVAPVMCGIL